MFVPSLLRAINIPSEQYKNGIVRSILGHSEGWITESVLKRALCKTEYFIPDRMFRLDEDPTGHYSGARVARRSTNVGSFKYVTLFY